MSPNADRQRRLLAIFEETMLQEPHAREAYVDRACGDEPGLRSDVMRLLVVNQEMGSFLEHPTICSAPPLLTKHRSPAPTVFESYAVWAQAEWGSSTKSRITSETRSLL